MCLLLFNSETSISNDKHIWIVPVSGTSILWVHLILKEITLHALPVILDVPGSSNWVRSVLAPLGDILITPVTDWIENISSSGIECQSHVRVSIESWNTLIIAIVVLEVVDSPFSVHLSILGFVSETARISLASLRSSRRIDSKLESFRMNIVSDSLHSIWKGNHVWHQIAGCISFLTLPTIINIDVFIAHSLKIGSHKFIGLIHNHRSIYITAKFVPCIPTHLWGWS